MATVNSWARTYPDGVGTTTNDFLGTAIDPSPDYAVLVQACRAYGETVEDPADVEAAIRRGLDRVHAGQAAVLDVRIAKLDGRQAAK